MDKAYIVLLAVYLSILQVDCTSEEIYKTVYQTNIVDGTYFNNIPVAVNSERESIIRFPKSTSMYPYTVFVWTEIANFSYPVHIMVRQQKEATSWELPLLVHAKTGTFQFYNTSRTLCHNNMDVLSRMPKNTTKLTQKLVLEKQLTVSISSASEISTTVILRIEEQENFFLEENKHYFVNISPSEPRFFYYKYPDRQSENFSSSIILEIESYDDICLTVSIQNASCPVFDLNEAISFKGQYQTIDTKGGIIIKRTMYPSGFFIVFVAKGDNYDCSQEKSLIPEYDNIQVVEPRNRSSVVMFKMKPTIFKGAYIQASVSIVVATLFFYLVVLSFSWFLLHFQIKCRGEDWGIRSRSFKHQNTNISMEDEVDKKTEINGDISNKNCDKIADEEAIHISEPTKTDGIGELRLKRKLILCDLARKDAEYLHKRSYNYLWHVLSIAIFYGIPVVQLVITYQRMLHTTGNQDICYYNFLCAHPFMGFSDFNHIFSNIGYVLAGIAFFVIVFYRHNRSRHKMKYQMVTGIPQNFGLYYAMSLALIMEGVLSACYHICPNQSNFQFDTSFMYVMVTLCIVKLYQNRHPDINATAYATFTVLGMGIFACMVGIITGHILLWIIFIIIYLCLCFYISLKVYFVRDTMQGLRNVNARRKCDGLLKLRPNKTDLFVILSMVNFINIIMALALSYILRKSFATYLLALLIGNALMYTIIYMVMKIRNGEQLYLRAIVFGLLSLVTWIVAMYFFKQKATSWKATAAKSRQLNKECILLGYYDFHDIWHLLSAPALFFSFMLILCLDDDLVKKPRNQIVVF